MRPELSNSQLLCQNGVDEATPPPQAVYLLEAFALQPKKSFVAKQDLQTVDQFLDNRESHKDQYYPSYFSLRIH